MDYKFGDLSQQRFILSHSMTIPNTVDFLTVNQRKMQNHIEHSKIKKNLYISYKIKPYTENINSGFLKYIH